MKEKPFRIVGSIKYGHCVAKIKYNAKYVVVKCKDSISTFKMIENGLNAFLRGGKNNPDGFHFHFYSHIKANPGGKIMVEYLSQPEEKDVYKLLVMEQQALDAGRSDTAMLNNQTSAHIPPYDESTSLYGWIPPAAVLNYQNWMKRRKKRTKKTSA